MKRKRTIIDDSVYPLFITSTIVRWLPVFSNPELAVDVLKLFEQLRDEMKMAIFAYCLMPSHIHTIIESAKKGDVSIFMRKWKSLSARIIINYGNGSNPGWITQFEENALEYKVRKDQSRQVWMPRFDDFAIRNKREFEIKANYIHGNPVRSGLVENCEDYPYSSIKDYLGEKNGFIRIEPFRG
jgi:putative transposase